MNMMTLKYIEKFKKFKGTYEEFVETIPPKDKRSINYYQFRNKCKDIERFRNKL